MIDLLRKPSTIYFVLLLILLGGFLVRLYHFDNPVADWHAWRQSDTSSVSRMFVENGIDILHPTFHDLSNVPSGLNNPNGFRFVEVPIYNAFQAGLFMFFGVFTLEQWGRLVTIVASLSTTVFLFLIVLRHAGKLAAILSAFFFTFLPFNIYFGRTILPDPSMTMMITGGIYFFDLYLESRIKNQELRIKSLLLFIISLIFTAVALLLKPFAIFFTLPMIVLAYYAFGISLFKKWQLYLFVILAVLPLALWRIWIMQFPEGIPVSSWLFNEGNIRFKGAYFYWIFADRIGRLILGYWGIGLMICGYILCSQKTLLGKFMKGKSWFFLSFIFSSLIYVIIIARGNVQHDYYQIPIVPSIALFLGLGSVFLLRPPKEFSRSFTSVIFIVCTVFTLLFGWYFVRDFFNINNPVLVSAGNSVDALVAKDAKVIALLDGDTTFLYQTGRKGWASLQNDIPEMIELGAEYLAIPSPTQADFEGFGSDYEIVVGSPELLLLKLQ